MIEKSGSDSKTLLNITFGLSVGGLFVLAVILAILNNNIQADIEGIKTGEVYAKSITYDKLGDDVFTTVEITLADGTETTARIISGEVSDGLLYGELELVLADGTTVIAEVNGYAPELEIEDGSITEKKLAEAVVTKLNDECEFELEDGSVITVKLADYAVTAGKLADGSVTTLKLLNGSITSGKLQDGIILTQHLGNSSVTTIKIADDSITTVKILDNVINSAKIADGSIDNIDISATADISWTKVSKLGSSLADLTTRDAVDLDIADVGGYFTLTHVEGALQEIADGTALDPTYLRLDASNDPVTGALTITPAADGTSILNVTKTDTTPVFTVDTTNALVDIGATGLIIARTAIGTGAAGTVGLIVKGAASQSANLLELQDSNGAITIATGDGLAGSEFVINEQGVDMDFRIEAVGADPALFVRGSDGNVGIGETGPSAPLSITTNSALTFRIDGTNANGTGIALTNSNDALIYFSFKANSAQKGYLGYDKNDGNMKFVSGTSLSNSSQGIIIDSTGDVGIGEVSPGARLQVNTGAVGTKGLIVKGAAAQSANLLELQDSGGAITIATGDGLAGSEFVINEQGVDMDFRIESSGVDPAFFVRGSDGNVGIGTAGPGAALHVDGNFTVGSGAPTYEVDIRSPGTLALGYNGGSGNVIIGTNVYTILKGAVYIGFQVPNGASVMKLYGSGGLSLGSTYHATNPGAGTMIIEGDLGIGIDNPGAKLDIRGGTDYNIDRLVLKIGNYTALDRSWQFTAGKLGHASYGNYPLIIQPYNSGSSGDFVVDVGTGDVVLQPTAGNVGIGTAGPNNMLEVVKGQNAGTQILVQNRTDGTASYAGIKVESDLNATSATRSTYLRTYAESHSTAAIAGRGVLATCNVPELKLVADKGSTVGTEAITFAVGSAAAEYMRINEGGNVGIRTTVPDFSLDVSGTVRIEGSNALYFGGTGAGDTLGNISHDATDFVFSDTIKPTGYKSSDGTAGQTATITVKGSDGNDCNLVFKDGLLTSDTCP